MSVSMLVVKIRSKCPSMFLPWVAMCGLRMSGRRTVRRKPVVGRIGGPSYVNMCVPVSRSLAKSPGMPLTNINDDSCGRQHPDRGLVNSFGNTLCVLCS